MNNSIEIGKKIRDIRTQKGLTQEELADRCELSKGFISQLERDLTSPSIATLIDILQCLGTDLKSFLTTPRTRRSPLNKRIILKRLMKRFTIKLNGSSQTPKRI